MGKAFDQIIKVQLDPIWNQLVRVVKDYVIAHVLTRTK